MHKWIWNIVSIFLAVVIIAGGTVASEWASEWAAPTEGTIYQDMTQGNSGTLRLENSEALALYPFDSYNPETCIPISDSDYYTKAWGKPIQDSDMFTLIDVLNQYAGAFLPLDDPDSTSLFIEGIYAYVLCDESSHYCYIKDYPTAYGDFDATLDIAFITDLRTDWYVPYQYCHVESPDTLSDSDRENSVQELTNWLNEYKDAVEASRYTFGKPECSEGNPFPVVFSKLKEIASPKRNLSHKSRDLTNMLQNFECMIYRDEIYCIFTSGSDRIVLIYNPAIRHFMGYSLYFP